MGKDTRVASSMVDLRLQLGDAATLEDYLRTSQVLPIGVFYKDSLSQSVKDAIKYITAQRQGSVFIPAQSESDNPTQIISAINKAGKLQINYITYGYRYPINDEARPLTDDDWQIGDIIYNTDTTINKCIGWVCKQAGTPGEWGVVGFIGNWATEIEEVELLPDPGPMQLNRQLVAGGRAYICKCVNGEYDWYWMDYAYGGSAQRPTTDLRVGLPYYNIETGLPEWYNGIEWVAAAKANHTHPELGGASDTPRYRTESGIGEYLYLPKCKEGFAEFSIKGTEYGISSLRLFSQENLYDVDELKPIADNTASSFTIEDEKVTFSNAVQGQRSVVAEIKVKVDPNTDYTYSHTEESSKNSIAVQILGEGVDVLISSQVLAGKTLRTTMFSTKVHTDEVTIKYIFESEVDANVVTYLSNIFVIRNPNASSDNPDLDISDYVSSPLYRSNDIADEYNGQKLVQRIRRSTIIDRRKDLIHYLNPHTYLADGYVLMQIDQKHGTLGDSTFTPESNSDVSALVNEISASAGYSIVSYDEARLGSTTEFLVGISTEGIIALSVPLTMMDNKNISTAAEIVFSYITDEINFVLKEEVISEFSRLPTPIRVHNKGVIRVYAGSSSALDTEISITYPENSAATAKSNTDVLDLMLHDRVSYGSAPLTWSESMTWAEAASANKDWRGE